MLDPWDLSSEIRGRQIASAAVAHGATTKECPDCEAHWDRDSEDHCATCGLSLDDLRKRLERRAT